MLLVPGASALDLTHAVVVAPPGLSRLEKKAVTLLVEEVAKRSQVRWEVRPDHPGTGVVVALGQTESLEGITGLKLEPSTNRAAEGFSIRVNGDAQSSSVVVVGNDSR